MRYDYDSRLERWKWGAAAAVVALVCFAASFSVCADSEPVQSLAPSTRAPADHSPSPDAQIAALRMALDREVEAREHLAQEVAALREQLETGGNASGSGAGQASGAAAQRVVQRSMFDDNSLVSAGIAPSDAQELRTRWEGAEMEKIHLIDRATREGWLGSARYLEEVRAIDDDLRGQLEGTDYDRYLFATGRNNRARITDVLSGSPGEAAGFRPGDTILSYDGERVFSIEELRELATRSRPADTIRVEVVQDGKVQTLHVRGGPIGLMLKPDREIPR